ncbi:hypothetical protein [Streptomyces sp. AK02-04a]|uniref:hypothetical protein n=1 Tax=Streptomyces sp. AK02-04a TaxID=3028649 RepID=UPI0029BE8C3F|nr:hypothetical protein [Streptomyces sp. AK02-04a]MDX3763925.1 hypothetical protein [Streptomyces sp. AK02-04a]
MIEFDAVIDTEGYTWQATTDEDGVLWLVADETVEVVINRAVVGGYAVSGVRQRRRAADHRVGRLTPPCWSDASRVCG